MTHFPYDHEEWAEDVFALDTPPSAFGELASFVALWQGKRAGRHLPAWTDFELEDFKDWYGWVAVFDVVSTDPFHIRVRLWGTQIVELFGYDLTGENTQQPGSRLLGHDDRQNRQDLAFKAKLCADPAIGVTEGSIFWDSREYVHIKEVFVPLSTDGRTVDKIMCATHQADAA